MTAGDVLYGATWPAALAVAVWLVRWLDDRHYLRTGRRTHEPLVDGVLVVVVTAAGPLTVVLAAAAGVCYLAGRLAHLGRR